MTMDIILKNGTIVTAADTFRGDIGIKDGSIALLAETIDPATYATDATTVLDAEGKYIFPGGVDVHTHLEMPFGGTVSKDDFATGTMAAACGGTTTLVDFAIQGKGMSLADTLAAWHAKADDKACIDYGFHVAVTDMTDDVLAELPEVVRNGCTSFKVFMTYDGLRVDDGVFMKTLSAAAKHGALVCVHAENYHAVKLLTSQLLKQGKTSPVHHADSRPPLVEAEATARACKLAQITDGPLYIVHLTCEDSLREVRQARAMGVHVMAETCPQYLELSYDNYLEPDFQGAKYVMSPPLRPVENQTPLWEGLKDGSLQTVATDHCPFDFKGQKEMGRDDFTKIPNGAPGVEARMAILYDRGVNAGRISLNKFVEVTSTNPAKIFGMYPNKGSIAVGGDADLVVFDPERKVTIGTDLLHENVDYTPYEGFDVTGWPEMTISGGKIVARDGEFVGTPGAGRYVKRKAPELL